LEKSKEVGGNGEEGGKVISVLFIERKRRKGKKILVGKKKNGKREDSSKAQAYVKRKGVQTAFPAPL